MQARALGLTERARKSLRDLVNAAFMGNFSPIHYLSQIQLMAGELTRANSASTSDLRDEGETHFL